MKSFISLSMFLLACFSGFAQVNFEGLPLGTKNYWKGDSGIAALKPFSSGSATFWNRNDTSSFGDYWSGWAYSAKQDTTSLDYANNDIACIANGGHNGSSIYGVAYQSFQPELNRILFSQAVAPQSMYITNTTIAYRSMQNGDVFAKKFGGATGTDPDYFRLHITGWSGANALADTIVFYLGDFRDSQAANDYIIKDWTMVDLTDLGICDSLTYWLESSDTSSTGMMNTPAYFCIDDLLTPAPFGITERNVKASFTVYPNPLPEQGSLRNETAENLSLFLYDAGLRLIQTMQIGAYQTIPFSLTHYPSGNYYLSSGKLFSGYTLSLTKQ